MEEHMTAQDIDALSKKYQALLRKQKREKEGKKEQG
jgi:hypothetical protein